jgi:hypothetical protein
MVVYMKKVEDRERMCLLPSFCNKPAKFSQKSLIKYVLSKNVNICCALLSPLNYLLTNDYPSRD